MKLFYKLSLLVFLFLNVSCDDTDDNNIDKKLYLKTMHTIQEDISTSAEHIYNEKHNVISTLSTTTFDDDEEYSSQINYEYDANDRIIYRHIFMDGEKYMSDSIIYNNQNQIIKTQTTRYNYKNASFNSKKFICTNQHFLNKLQLNSDNLNSSYTIYEYNSKGQKISSKMFSNDGLIAEYTTYEYDEIGNMNHQKMYSNVTDIENLPNYYQEMNITYNDKNAPGKYMNISKLTYDQISCPATATITRHSSDGSTITTTEVYTCKFNSNDYPIELTLETDDSQDSAILESTLSYIE